MMRVYCIILYLGICWCGHDLRATPAPAPGEPVHQVRGSSDVEKLVDPVNVVAHGLDGEAITQLLSFTSIRYLGLSTRNLRDAAHFKALASLPLLSHLSLACGNDEGVANWEKLFKELADTKLAFLGIGAYIQGSWVFEIAKMSALEELRLNDFSIEGGELSDEDLGVLGTCATLTSLKVVTKHDLIGSKCLEGLSRLQNLSSLTVGGLWLNANVVEGLSKLSRLSSLRLSSVYGTDEELGSLDLSSLPLNDLELMGHTFSDAALLGCLAGTRLKSLRVDVGGREGGLAGVTGLFLVKLDVWDDLELLQISVGLSRGNADGWASVVAKMPKLRWLQLVFSGNSGDEMIGDAEIQALLASQSLEDLHLTNISGISLDILEQVAGAPRIKTLSLVLAREYTKENADKLREIFEKTHAASDSIEVTVRD